MMRGHLIWVLEAELKFRVSREKGEHSRRKNWWVQRHGGGEVDTVFRHREGALLSCAGWEPCLHESTYYIYIYI